LLHPADVSSDPNIMHELTGADSAVSYIFDQRNPHNVKNIWMESGMDTVQLHH